MHKIIHASDETQSVRRMKMRSKIRNRRGPVVSAIVMLMLLVNSKLSNCHVILPIYNALLSKLDHVDQHPYALLAIAARKGCLIHATFLWALFRQLIASSRAAGVKQ